MSAAKIATYITGYPIMTHDLDLATPKSFFYPIGKKLLADLFRYL
jgi:hypothetical protein